MFRSNPAPAETHRFHRNYLLQMITMLLLTIGFSADGQAMEIYRVTKTADTYDLACNADCSLREAIVGANGNPGLDIIYVPAGHFLLTRTGSDNAGIYGDLDITDSVIISGAGPDASIVDATGLGDRVLHVTEGGISASLSGLTITGGNPPGHGGGIFVGEATLRLGNTVVTGNQAGISGGGIATVLADLLAVEDGSVVSDNSALSDDGGGIYAQLATLELTDATVAGNHAMNGGGVRVRGGSVSVTRSTISGNSADSPTGGRGGGLFINGVLSGVSELVNSTICDNHASYQGGGLVIFNEAEVSAHSITLHGNTSLETTGVVVDSTSRLNTVNSVYSGPCTIDGLVATSGGNVESPGNTCDLSSVLDHVSVADPKLLDLGSYGGPTRTAMPGPDSPVLGASNAAYCLSTDQRGVSRSALSCDAGAVERQNGDVLFATGFETGHLESWSSTTE